MILEAHSSACDSLEKACRPAMMLPKSTSALVRIDPFHRRLTTTKPSWALSATSSDTCSAPLPICQGSYCKGKPAYVKRTLAGSFHILGNCAQAGWNQRVDSRGRMSLNGRAQEHRAPQKL